MVLEVIYAVLIISFIAVCLSLSAIYIIYHGPGISPEGSSKKPKKYVRYNRYKNMRKYTINKVRQQIKKKK